MWNPSRPSSSWPVFVDHPIARSLGPRSTAIAMEPHATFDDFDFTIDFAPAPTPAITPPPFDDGAQSLENTILRCLQSRVLMVGAGGIGCELLKNIVLLGFGKIHVVDLDTIDLSNLNRQFLFRHEHIKKSKALVCDRETAVYCDWHHG